MIDALLLGLVVAGEAALALAMAAPLLTSARLGRARGPVALAILSGMCAGAWAARRALGGGAADAALAMPIARARHLLGFALASLAFASRRAEVQGDATSAAVRRVAVAVALAIAVAWSAPEAASAASKLTEAAALTGDGSRLVAAALAGAALAAALGVAFGAWLQRLGAGPALRAPAVLGLLFAVKVVGPAAAAAGLPPLTSGFAALVGRSVHDAVHLGFVLAQLPDHPFLRDGAYQLILFFLDPRLHLALAALLLCVPVGLAWADVARRRPPPLGEQARAPERRRLRAHLARGRRATGAAFALALTLMAGAAWAARDEGEALHDPLPEPAADDGHGYVVVILNGAGRAPGRMRKWVYELGGRAVVFFVVPRPDGSLAVALDRCAVCQPRGYGQLGRDYVFCKHCRTPIPAASVGQRGGCNPIPLPGARVQGSALRIAVAELEAALRAERAQR